MVLQPITERPWYRFQIVETAEQVLASRGSVYHVTPLDEMSSQILAGPERSYAVVALPCVAKAIRLAQRRVPLLRRRIRYVLGLTCGGHRSLLFADLLTALMGQSEGVLRYRSKRNSRNALDFRTELETGRSVRSVKMLGLFGYLWINGVGGLQCCLFCDDVFAELADATFMDAWLPEYQPDRRGTSLVISRNEKLSDILTALFQTEQCEGGRIAPERIEESQIGLLNRRRNLMAARCRVANDTLGYAPEKRLTICSSDNGETQQAQANRELNLCHDLRDELLRYRSRISRKSGWVARWYAWRLCWKILLVTTRHGFLAKTIRGAKHLSSKLSRPRQQRRVRRRGGEQDR